MKATLATLITSALLAASAAAQDITIGTANDFPPFIIHQPDGTVSGLEAELMEAICTRAGWTCRWEVLPFDILIDALEAGEVDLAAAGLANTPARAARVHVTCPYDIHDSDASWGHFYVRDPGHDPLSGAMAAVRGTLMADELAARGLDLRLYPDIAPAIRALLIGEVSAFATTADLVGEYPQLANTTRTGRFALPPGGVSLAATPTRPDLGRSLDAHLATLSRDGTIAEITTRWYGTALEDPISLCQQGPATN